MSHITNEMWSSTGLLLQAYTDNGTEGVEAALEDIQSQLLRAYEEDAEKDLKRDKQKIYDTLDHLRIGTIAGAEKELGAQLGVEVNYTGTDIKARITEVVADDLYDSYKSALLNISNQVAEIIYKRADEVDEMGEDIAEEVASLANRQEWRAVRFGFTEQQVVMAITAQMLWEWAQKEYNFKGYKTWHISSLSPAPCEECIKTNNEQVHITEKFSNGAMYPPLHPNCYCYLTYSTERTSKQVGRVEQNSEDALVPKARNARRHQGADECVAAGQANAIGEANADAQPTLKITCPKCGRFLMDTSKAKIQKIKCPNTKCKAWLSIDTIKDGATIVKEISNE